MHDGQFLKSSSSTLGIKTVRSAIDHVVETFREHERPNPTLDIDGLVSWLLTRQCRSYNKDDPKAVQEKALPLCVIKLIALKTSTEKQKAIGQLIIGAFFLACRLCEYLKVPNQDQQLSKQLVLGNIVFYKGGQIVPHDCYSIFLADSVSITFEAQKNEQKFDTITQWATLHPVLCPVKQWTEIVKAFLRILDCQRQRPCQQCYNTIE